MLFILVMDVLGHMFSKADADDMLQPLAKRVLPHRISIYADVVLFIRPEGDIALTMDILNLFGAASGLKTNLQKSDVLPIRCEDHDLQVVQQQLPCARYRKGKNFITSVLSRVEQTLTLHKDKAAEFIDFYDGLLGTHESRDVTIDFDALEVPSYELAQLDAPFSKEEVWETIKCLPSDKAPGPDGFTGRFYKTCWPIIKSEIMAAISCVWARKFRNMRALNSAFITLLPKLQPHLYAKDYMSISLVHSFAKLVTKVLANRLVGCTKWYRQTNLPS
jgi:hypothetical protein